MSLNNLNIDMLTALSQSLDLASILSLMRSSIVLNGALTASTFLWRDLIVRDFGFLASDSATTNSNSNADTRPNATALNYYSQYRTNYLSSYNLCFGRQVSPTLSWREFHRYANSSKPSLLDVRIGRGPLCKRFPLPAEKLLRGYNSVVVHEFEMKEALNKLDRVVLKNALRVLTTKLFRGQYDFRISLGSLRQSASLKKKSKKEKRAEKESFAFKDGAEVKSPALPVVFHFVGQTLYFAYFYNAHVTVERDDNLKRVSFRCDKAMAPVENCIEAFKENWRIGYSENSDWLRGNMSSFAKERACIDHSIMEATFMIHDAYTKWLNHEKALPDEIFVEEYPSRMSKERFPLTFSPRTSTHQFEVPMEVLNFCSPELWCFCCFFGLALDEDYRFNETNGLRTDWNVRYIPTFQKVTYKNFSFYALAGSPGCVSFDLPEPIANVWNKQSLWKRFMMRKEALLRAQAAVEKDPDQALDTLPAENSEDFESETFSSSSSASEASDDAAHVRANDVASGRVNAQQQERESGQELAALARLGLGEPAILAVQDMGFAVTRRAIIQALLIDGTVDTAVASILSSL